MNQGAAMVVPMVIGSLPNVTSFDGFRRIFICIMLSSVWSGVMWFFIRGLMTG
ncbi:conjugal transfer protein TrbA, partial [Escherichia coli]|nr:conjugal transfer protein TrbA [Escherichia coli]